jgi:ubiquinone/menaquinone biosynthesis C-methylase UbiE
VLFRSGRGSALPRAAREAGVTVVIDPEEYEVRAIHSLVDFRNKSVLEIGSGDGRLTWRFAGSTRRVLGIEPYGRDVGRANAAMPSELKPKVRFVEGSARNYRFPREAFDVAILSYSL